MLQLKTYNLFFSHSWVYSDTHEKLVKLLNEDSDFLWADYSIPKNNPVHNAPDETTLYNAIENQMRFTDCVVVMSGVYSIYSKWINIEIEIAKNVFSKPIIVVDPWGTVKTSETVKDNADETVKWHRSSIVNADETVKWHRSSIVNAIKHQSDIRCYHENRTAHRDHHYDERIVG